MSIIKVNNVNAQVVCSQACNPFSGASKTSCLEDCAEKNAEQIACNSGCEKIKVVYDGATNVNATFAAHVTKNTPNAVATNNNTYHIYGQCYIDNPKYYQKISTVGYVTSQGSPLNNPTTATITSLAMPKCLTSGQSLISNCKRSLCPSFVPPEPEPVPSIDLANIDEATAIKIVEKGFPGMSNTIFNKKAMDAFNEGYTNIYDPNKIM
ncbi:MAG: hypothetical protein LBU68_00220 [Rickettsiales bacterium]|nr:hypothetical protein [Rickettsiales bacterium]